MAKVQIKSEKLTPFGGIFMVMEQFDYMLSSVIDSTLGQRCSSIIGYRCILTNDYESSARAVVEFYNLRGGKERIFDDMNNGFGWNRLPKSFMESRFTKCARFPKVRTVVRQYLIQLLQVCLKCPPGTPSET